MYMKSAGRVVLIALLVVVPSQAQENPIAQMFRSICAQPAGGPLPTTVEFFTKVNENTIRALSVAELNAILPLALQCIHSANPEVRGDGIRLFIATMLRFDSAKVLGPYTDDLGKLLDGDQSMRGGAIAVLGGMLPKPTPKALDYLRAHLEDSRNSDEQTTIIAASLLKAAPDDAPTLHRIILIASRSDPHSGMADTVLRELGLSRSRLPEAMDYISANLNQTDPYLRASAVDAASRLDSDERAQFSSQLTRIANDPKESQYVRNQAKSALASR